MIENSLVLITIILIGYFAKQLNILKKEDGQTLTKLLVTFMLPAVVIGNFSKATVDLNLINFTLSCFISLLILMFIGFLFAKFLKLNKKTGKSSILLIGGYWGSTFAYPIMLLYFGEVGFRKFIFYDLAFAILVVTLYNYVAIADKDFKLKDNLIRLIKNPMFLALPIALFLNLINFQTSFTDSLFEIIPKGIIFLGLMIVGLNLNFNISDFKLPLLIIILKTIIGFIIGLFLVYLFGFTGLDKTIILVASVLPPSLMAMIYSEQNKLDTKLVANTLSLSLPVSIFFINLIIYFF